MAFPMLCTGLQGLLEAESVQVSNGSSSQFVEQFAPASKRISGTQIIVAA